MTLYRFLDGVAGRPGVGSSGTTPPAATTAYAGPWLDGISFAVTQGGMWLNAYWHWVAPGGDTFARKFALWAFNSATAGALVPGSVVTSGVLTAGAMNRIPLATPIPLAIGFQYNACTGRTSVNGFENSNNQFTTAQPYAGGIVNGPCVAYSDAGGTNTNPQYPTPSVTPQGLFSTGGSDPSLAMPSTGSNSAIFWQDVEISDTAPSGYLGPFDAWPGVPALGGPNGQTGADIAQFYNVGTRFKIISVPGFKAQCIGFKYYSPATATALAGAAHVWSFAGGGIGTPSIVGGTSAPSWSGAAGSGWVSCSVTAFDLPVAEYAAAVWNNANAVAAIYSSKDTGSDYYRNGFGKNGWTSGPLQIPQLSAAGLGWNYNGVAAGTPPYSDGTTQNSQPIFGQSGSQAGPEPNPYLNAPISTPTAGSTQNYWVTPIVQLVATSGGALVLSQGSGHVLAEGIQQGALTTAGEPWEGD